MLLKVRPVTVISALRLFSTNAGNILEQRCRSPRLDGGCSGTGTERVSLRGAGCTACDISLAVCISILQVPRDDSPLLHFWAAVQSGVRLRDLSVSFSFSSAISLSLHLMCVRAHTQPTCSCCSESWRNVIMALAAELGPYLMGPARQKLKFATNEPQSHLSGCL